MKFFKYDMNKMTDDDLIGFFSSLSFDDDGLSYEVVTVQDMLVDARALAEDERAFKELGDALAYIMERAVEFSVMRYEWYFKATDGGLDHKPDPACKYDTERQAIWWGKQWLKQINVLRRDSTLEERTGEIIAIPTEVDGMI